MHVLDGAATKALADIICERPITCAVIAIDSQGSTTVHSTGRAFLTATACPSYVSASVSGSTFAIYPQHIVYESRLLSAGLTRYPTTNGHMIAQIRSGLPLMSLPRQDFLDALTKCRWIAAQCPETRCGLASDGSDTISLIPLNGVAENWEPITHLEEVYFEEYPGFLSTKNGPKMPEENLDATHKIVTHATGLSKDVHNLRFDGEMSDQNLFARIVRGELQQ